FSRYAISSCVAAALLAACGGSQPPVVAPGAAMPQGRASSGYSILHSFGKRSSDGAEPKAALIDVNGTLYGTTYGGGKYGAGTVFGISTSGSENVLYSFNTVTKNDDGANPSAGLLAVNSLLYGTTEYGGSKAQFGTVFRVSTTGREKVLHRFIGYYSRDRYDGANPIASLIDVRGRLYGTTYHGGANQSNGTVFKMSTSGREKVLHSFSVYGDGGYPAANLLNVKGTLYGTTEDGGTLSGEGGGTVFSITTTGTEKVLYGFVYEGSDGNFPATALSSVHGLLYGTTAESGDDDGGTAFGITTSGNLTNLHYFGSSGDGNRPVAPLLNVNGTLYGTTAQGGLYGKGTVFKMSLSGTEKVLHSFGYGSDGATPLAGLTDVNGTLYGTTSAGGTYVDGTVFALKL
ncbi:MAG: choice-of-anchor tandem repeat GloVer-containing protein, partial [Candidatus Cybelea sp.]